METWRSRNEPQRYNVEWKKLDTSDVYEFFELGKWIYTDKNQNSNCFRGWEILTGKGQMGIFWNDRNVLQLDLDESYKYLHFCQKLTELYILH